MLLVFFLEKKGLLKKKTAQKKSITKNELVFFYLIIMHFFFQSYIDKINIHKKKSERIIINNNIINNNNKYMKHREISALLISLAATSLKQAIINDYKQDLKKCSSFQPSNTLISVQKNKSNQSLASNVLTTAVAAHEKNNQYDDQFQQESFINLIPYSSYPFFYTHSISYFKNLEKISNLYGIKPHVCSYFSSVFRFEYVPFLVYIAVESGMVESDHDEII